MSIDKELQELTNKWYAYVSSDHHKDRDCHFYITLDYKYGELPIFEIDHYGYVGDEFHAKAHTLEKAKEILLERIKRMVALQGEWADEVLNTDGWDTYQVKQAKLYKELFSEGGIDK
jgi:hypothetical protein